MNMKLLLFVTPQSIYNGCSTHKTFWGGKFTLGEFTPVNMKHFGRCNVRKYREIKDSDKYIALDIFLESGSLKNMRITSSDPNYYWVRSVKRLINYLGLNINVRPKKYKKASYAITNVSMKDLSNIIKEF